MKLRSSVVVFIPIALVLVLALGAAACTGPQGLAGPQGSAGPQGTAGIQGPAGPEGKLGPAGPQGSAGPEGKPGPVGPQGPAGVDGKLGLAGAVGPQGPKGEPPVSTYKAQTRSLTVTTIPAVTHEMQGASPYLKDEFAKGGLLDGKEVYAFSPEALVVYQGDTLKLTLVNPNDDDHTFTIADLGVNVQMAGKSKTDTTIVASKVGTFTYFCAVSEHMPYMWGTLVVMPGSAGPQ